MLIYFIGHTKPFLQFKISCYPWVMNRLVSEYPCSINSNQVGASVVSIFCPWYKDLASVVKHFYVLKKLFDWNLLLNSQQKKHWRYTCNVNECFWEDGAWILIFSWWRHFLTPQDYFRFRMTKYSCHCCIFYSLIFFTSKRAKKALYLELVFKTALYHFTLLISCSTL